MWYSPAMTPDRTLIPAPSEFDSDAGGFGVDLVEMAEASARIKEAAREGDEVAVKYLQKVCKYFDEKLEQVGGRGEFECVASGVDLTNLPENVRQTLENPDGEHGIKILKGSGPSLVLNIYKKKGGSKKFAAWTIVELNSHNYKPTGFNLMHFPGGRESPSECMLPFGQNIFESMMAAKMYEAFGPALADAMETKLTPQTTKQPPKLLSFLRRKK